MMKKLVLFLILISLVVPQFAEANHRTYTWDDGFVMWLIQCGENAEHLCSLTHFFRAVVKLINLAIAFSGIFAVIMIIKSGYQMIIGGISGKEERYKQGKESLKNSIIGLVIVLFSYVIINSVMTIVFKQNNWFSF